MISALLPVALLLAAPAQAGPHPKLELQLDEYAIQTRDYCFASGLRLSFQQDHSQPVVSVTSVIDRGSDADPVGQEGIAHLVEHLWFRSRHGELPPTWDLLDEMGATINAFTAKDVTAYMTVAPKAMLPAVLKLEGQRLLGAVDGVTAEVITTEREVVRNELRQYEAMDLGMDPLYAKLYPRGHAYARSTIGTRETLDAIGLAEVQAFVDENYRPENATIMVVGDLSLDEIPQLLAESLPPELVFHPDAPDGPASAEACPVRIAGPSEPPPDPVDRTVERIKAPVERPMVIMAWSLPGAYRPDQPLMDLASTTLTWAVSSGINPSAITGWRDQNEAWCYLDPGELASTAVCGIELRHDADPEKVIKKAADGLYQLWDPEMRRWQDRYYSLASLQIMARTFRSADEVATLFGSRSTDAALFTHFTGSSAYYSTSFGWLGAVNGQDASRLAYEYLTRDRFAAVILEPFDEDEAGLADEEAGYTGRPREPVDSVMDLASIDAALIDELTVVPELSQLRDFTLDNGLRVVILPYGTVPIARAALLARGGDLHEPLPGLDRLAWDHAGSDVPGLEVELDEAPLRVGGDWQDWDLGDMRVLQVSGSAANLDAQLWLLQQRVEHLEHQSTDRRAYVRSLRRHLQYDRELPEHWEGVLARKILVGDHPLGRSLDDATLTAIAEHSDEMAQRWNQRMFQPANSTLLLVGRFDADEAEQAARSTFAGWKAAPSVGEPLPALQPTPTSPERSVLVLDKPQVSQTQLMLRCQLTAAQDGDSETRALLAKQLDEMAWVTLRENAGVTYGSGVWASTMAGSPSLLTMYTSVQNDAVDLAASTFLGLVDKAHRGDLDPDLLKLSKLGEARRYVLDQQSTSQMLDRLTGPLAMDRGWEELTEHGARLAAVEIEALPPLMESCAGREVLTLVGPQETILEELQQAGLSGEVFDWEAERDRLWAEHNPKGWKSEQKRRVKVGE